MPYNPAISVLCIYPEKTKTLIWKDICTPMFIAAVLTIAKTLEQPTYKYIYCCSVAQPCPTLCNCMDCSTPGLPIPHRLLDFAQAHVHRISDAVQPSHPLTPSSPSALNLSQHQGLFQWVICLYQMAKILERKLQHQSFQWLIRVDLP